MGQPTALASGQILINTVDLKSLIERIGAIEKHISRNSLREKLDLLTDGEIITSKIVKRVMGWSEKVFQNRLHKANPLLPMIKNPEGRWECSKEEFTKWYFDYTNYGL